MMKQAIDYVKDIGKFSAGTGLIATKVESMYADDMVINGIVYFLQTAIYDLPQIIQDPVEQQNCKNLLEALITQFNATAYSRIGLSRQPNIAGPLDQIPLVMDSKPQMVNVTWDFTQFVPKEPSDFGLSLSDTAKLLLFSLIQETLRQIESAFEELAIKIQNHYTRHSTLTSDLYRLIDFFVRDYRILSLLPGNLDLIDNARNFLNVVESNLQSLNFNFDAQGGSDFDSEFGVILKGIMLMIDRIEFFASAGELDPVVPLKSWAIPVKNSVTFMDDLMYKVALKVNENLKSITNSMATSIGASLRAKYNGGIYPAQVIYDLDSDYFKISPFVPTLQASRTLLEFVGKDFPIFFSLTVPVDGNVLSKLPDLSLGLALDLENGPPIPVYEIELWVRPFQDLLNFLRQQRDALDLQIMSPRVTNYGSWGGRDTCPPGTFVGGFQLRTQSYQGWFGDDSAVNAINFFCSPVGQPNTNVVATVASKVGSNGGWGTKYFCGGVDKAVGFQLNSQPDQGWGLDDSAAQNFRLICSDGSIFTGDGLNRGWGSWTGGQRCLGGRAICSISTQVGDDQGGITGINNVDSRCCNLIS